MKIITILFFALILSSCKTEKKQDPVNQTEQKTNSENAKTKEFPKTSTEGDIFIEYYPNSSKVKFKGSNDTAGKRHGKWLHFSESGLELSMSMYNHGVLDGHSMVKYPNGKIHYIGQYKNGERIGTWSFYDTDGVKTEQTFSK